MKTLDEIALQYEGGAHPTIDTDKSTHGYTGFYDEILGHLREQPCTILDIGVNTGGSIRMWEEGFPLAKIIGIDRPGGCAEYASVPARCAWKHSDASLRDVGSLLEPLGNAV